MLKSVHGKGEPDQLVTEQVEDEKTREAPLIYRIRKLVQITAGPLRTTVERGQQSQVKNPDSIQMTGQISDTVSLGIYHRYGTVEWHGGTCFQPHRALQGSELSRTTVVRSKQLMDSSTANRPRRQPIYPKPNHK